MAAVACNTSSSFGVEKVSFQHTATIPWALACKSIPFETPWFTNVDCSREDMFWRIEIDSWAQTNDQYGQSEYGYACTDMQQFGYYGYYHGYQHKPISHHVGHANRLNRLNRPTDPTHQGKTRSCWLRLASNMEMQNLNLKANTVAAKAPTDAILSLIPDKISGNIAKRLADGTVKSFGSLQYTSPTPHLHKNTKLSLGSFQMPSATAVQEIEISVTICLIRWTVEPAGAAASVDTCCSSCKCDVLHRIGKSRLLTDVELRCEEESIHAHKAVLAAESPVFEAMFTKNFKEKQNRVVPIEGLQPEALRIAVESLYGESLPAMSSCGSDMLVDLLRVAERYQLQSLKNACEKLLLKDTSQDPVQLLILADTYNVAGLKEAVLRRIASHRSRKELIDDKTLKTLSESRSSLVADILNAVM